ncbi:hypothetical protein Y032_0285g1362 [Ancylostoma ceylanicum]|uniref:ABC transporter domain-containing protein n=1 Tax=Ancylostoma ceylanicum TaxID=53326 RepID=A0A016S6R1_9BILA|nr:hypothetical protein Y032_0285g1362 [Ancylostoma ceylanicum]
MSADVFSEPTTSTTVQEGSLRPFREQLVSIVWKDISVRTMKGRQILDGISGIALPGEVMAVMGASASGKTTLLNTLLHRNLQGLIVEGEVLVNGQNIGSAVTSVSAYVQQEDLFVGTLTFIRPRVHFLTQMRCLDEREHEVEMEKIINRYQVGIDRMKITCSETVDLHIHGYVFIG